MIYYVGESFVVLTVLEEDKSRMKMFTGKITWENGVVTHLWLRGFPDICEVGYPVEDIRPATPEECGC